MATVCATLTALASHEVARLSRYLGLQRPLRRIEIVAPPEI